jgi:hypothetical protein
MPTIETGLGCRTSIFQVAELPLGGLWNVIWIARADCYAWAEPITDDSPLCPGARIQTYC